MNHAREGAFQTFTAPLRSIIRVPYTKHNHKQNLLDEIYENKVWVKLVGRKLLGNDSIRGWNETDTFSRENFSCRLRVVRPRNFRWIFKRRSPTRASLPFHAQGPHVESLVRLSYMHTDTGKVKVSSPARAPRSSWTLCELVVYRVEIFRVTSSGMRGRCGSISPLSSFFSSFTEDRRRKKSNETFLFFFFWKNSKNRFEKEFLSTRESSLSLSLSLIDSQGKTDRRDGRRRWDRWGKFVKSIYRGS